MFKKLFLTLSLAGVAFSINLFAADTLFDKIKKDGVIKIATEGTYAPFSYHNEKNELVGYDVDIARAVADKLGVKAEFVEAPWDAMLAAFDANKADVVFNQAEITQERKKKYDYTIPYTTSYSAVIVHKDDDSVKSYADLKGKRSAHSANSKYARMAEENGATLVTIDSFSKAVELIATKRADTTVNDVIAFLDFIKQRPNTPIKIAFTGSEPVYSAALVKKGNEALVEAINEAILELKKSGKAKEISMKYFGKDISD